LPTILKKTILLIFLAILSACEQQAEIENPNKIFTDSEVKELNWMVSEFDSILASKYKAGSVEENYKNYLKDTENYTFPILNGMDKLGVQVMNLSVFSKIWWRYDNSLGNSGNYNIDAESEYLVYLKHIGESNDFIENYADKFSSAHDINPSVASEFSYRIKDVDLSDKNYRLIFAIHYLTLFNR